MDAPLVTARLFPPEGTERAVVERTEWLTPYAAEEILDDARWAGRGARLELSFAREAPDVDVSRVQRKLARLCALGVTVDVRRDLELPQHVAETKARRSGELPPPR